MIEITVNVDGDRQVVDRLVSMTDAILERLRKVLPELGAEVKDVAAALAPRKSGKLAGGLTATLREPGKDRIVEMVGVGRQFYGRFQETGLDTTRKPARHRGIVGVRARMRGGTVLISPRRGLTPRQAGWSEHPFHLPAHPFLHPAVDSMRSRIVAGIQAAVTEEIK